MPSQISVALAELSRSLREQETERSKKEAREAWYKADLSYNFWNVQKKMAEVLDAPGSLKKVLNCSRRLRKTTTALTKSVELGLKKECAVRFAAPTQKMMRNIIHPIMRMICKDAPPELRPVWKSQDGFYLFPKTRAELHVAGCNNGHEDDLRGTAADLCVVDEAQKVTNLKYVVQDVLMPQLLTTNGQLWMLFTPPKTPVHDCVAYAQEAQAKNNGSYAEFNIHEGEYPEDLLELFCKEAGGEESTTWQREYLVQFVVDKNFSIVPEWKDLFIEEYVPDEYFKFYFKYESMDIGVRDLTLVLFGVYDFKKATLFIQDEFCINGPQMTTQKVAEGIKAKEPKLWGEQKPFMRVGDNDNLILLNDLGILHGLPFVATDKDTLESMVNFLRLWVHDGRIKVSPNCVQTIGCLKYGVWDDRRKNFERSTVYGHFDALSALIYLLRHIDTHTNPIPKNFGLDPYKHFIRDQNAMTEEDKKLMKALNVLNKKKR